MSLVLLESLIFLLAIWCLLGKHEVSYGSIVCPGTHMIFLHWLGVLGDVSLSHDFKVFKLPFQHLRFSTLFFDNLRLSSWKVVEFMYFLYEILDNPGRHTSSLSYFTAILTPPPVNSPPPTFYQYDQLLPYKSEGLSRF